jgi:hypothetical protein
MHLKVDRREAEELGTHCLKLGRMKRIKFVGASGKYLEPGALAFTEGSSRLWTSKFLAASKFQTYILCIENESSSIMIARQCLHRVVRITRLQSCSWTTRAASGNVRTGRNYGSLPRVTRSLLGHRQFHNHTSILSDRQYSAEDLQALEIFKGYGEYGQVTH